MALLGVVGGGHHADEQVAGRAGLGAESLGFGGACGLGHAPGDPGRPL